MSVIEIIEISSDQDDDDASTLVDVSLEKTDDIDVQQYSDRRITKTQPQYKDANNPEIIDSQYLINKLINSNAKIINSLMEQNQLLSFTNDSISQGNDEYLKLYATRYENNIMDSLSRIKIVKIESLNVQENLTADIIDSYNDNDVQEVIPDSNRQNSSNGNTNQLNLKNIEETTNDICHQESSTVIETPIDNEFPLFKRKDLKEISNSKLQTKIISNYTLNILKKYLPLVRLDRITIPETNIISSSNAKNNTNSSSNAVNNINPLSNAGNDIISVSNEESNIFSSRNAENNVIPTSNAENDTTSSSNVENNYCKECNCFFASAKKSVYHKRYRHNGSKRYNCRECDYASNDKSHLICHKRRHTGERPYQCVYCSFTYKQRWSFQLHLLTHIDKNLSCDICHEKFKKVNLLINHIIYYHSFSPSVRARQCKVCQELLPDRYSLKIHTETHKYGSFFKCNISCYATKSSQNLLVHDIEIIDHNKCNNISCNQTMSVIEIIEISSGEDDDGASTIMNMPLGKTDDIDVQQYSDRRITKTQPQYKDANNPEIIDSQYLINKLINSNAKIINSLMEQNQLLSFTNDSISQGNDEYLKLYATRYENNIMDSLSRIKIVKIESLNVQENLTADIIDSYDDNDVQEVIPDSNRQNSSNGNTNQLNLKNIEETTNDICHRESSTVIETPIDNEFPLFKRKDLKEISNSKHQTEKISKSSLKKFNKCLPMVELDRISVSENNIISLSNAENDIIFGHVKVTIIDIVKNCSIKMNINNDTDTVKIEFNENSTILDPEYHETRVVDKENMEDLDETIINEPIVKDTMKFFENNLNSQVDNNFNYYSVINLYESDLNPSNKTWISRNNSLSSVNSDQASLLTDDFFISNENEHQDKSNDLLSYIKITKVESLSGRNGLWTETIDENNDEEQNIIYDIKKENFDYNDKADGSNKTIDEQNQFKKCIDMAASSTPVKNTSLANKTSVLNNDNFKNNQISLIETLISNQRQIKAEDNTNSFDNSHHISNIPKSFLPSVLLERIEVPGKVIGTSKSVAKTNETKLTEVSFESETNKPVDSEKLLKNNKPRRRIGKLPCKECGYLALSKSYLNLHMRKHSDEKPIQCPECPFRTSYKSSLTPHMRRYHPDQIVACKPRDSKLTTANHLKKSMRIHTEKDPITCDICKKTFRKLSYLKRHMICHSDERPYECNICHFKFKRAYDLTSHLGTHIVTHTEKHTEKHQCKICSREFTRIYYLNMHLKVHSEKQYKCEICNRNFLHLYFLNQHIELHKPCPPGEVLKCQFCHESYNDQFSLRNHTKTHKQGKIYKCTVCCYKTTDSLALIEHANDHTNNKLCICYQCGHSFEKKKFLRQHMIQNHIEKKQASKRKRPKIN
ncbi:uncharacterized protein LOC103568491 [Microplitis demolitor]|uniref:uncharacterized protein LOC103568491 n=1 Tax=Microplitis demolitor TaxID=69319 RepID=UPI00235B5B4D|nr:uncharacterized protein LOC103568491 [Microplitis demolitor]